MKKIMIFILMVFLIAIGVSASWVHNGNDAGRQYVQTDGLFESDSGVTANFTCGTNSGYQQVKIGLWDDDDSKNEIFISCHGDSENAINHLYMLSDQYSLLDTITLTADLPDGLQGELLAASNGFQFDGDANVEFALLNFPDTSTTGGISMSILIYEFNQTTDEFIKDYEQIIFDNVVIVNTSASNYTWVGDGNPEPTFTSIDCFQESGDTACYVTDGTHVFKTNLSENGSVEWIYKLSGINAGMTPAARDNEYNIFPMYSEFDGGREMIFIDTDRYISINSNGTITRNFTIAITGTLNYAMIYDCDTGRCISDRPEIFVGSTTGSVYGEMFDSLDGDKLHTITGETLGDSPNSVIVWVEDRDDDDTEEICIFGLQTTLSGTIESVVKCEEMNLFQFDTLDAFVNVTAADDQTQGNAVITDFDGDGDYDIITGNMAITLPTTQSSGQILSVDNTLFNESVIGNFIVHVLSEVSSSSSADLISFASGTSDTYFITSTSLTPEAAVGNSAATFNLNPVQQISDPICQDEDLFFNCSLSNGCYNDTESDRIKLLIDCFDDGTQLVGGDRFSHTQNDYYCDLSQTNLTGNVNVTFTIWDENHAQTENDSVTLDYRISDTNTSCFTELNPGVISDPEVNVRPYFTGFPVSITGEPFCLNSTIIYDCDSTNCYTDGEGDDIYLRVDCDDDDVWDVITFLGDEDFSCRYTTSGSSQVTMEVCDAYHSTCDSLTFSVTISNRTAEDVIADGDLDCSDSYLYDDDGNSVLPDLLTSPFFTNGHRATFPSSRPYCVDDPIEFNCFRGQCYSISDADILTSMQIDYDNDGTADKTTFFATNHTYNVVISESDLSNATLNNVTGFWEMPVGLRIINIYGQVDTLTEEVIVSNNTILCMSSSEIETIEEDDMTAFDETIDTLAGGSFRFKMILGLALIIFITAGIVASVHKKGVRGDAIVTIGVITAFISTILVTMIGLLPAYIIIIMLVAGVLFLVYNHFFKGGE